MAWLRQLVLVAACCGGLAIRPGLARAQTSAAPAVTGVAQPARYPDDAARTAGDWLLFLPRNVVEYTFRGAELAANLVADQQLVPRYRELFGKPGEELFVFPTLFADTETPTSVGLRMIFNSKHVATSQRIGYGGPQQVEVESRVVLKGTSRTLPFILSLESYYQLADNLQYWGVGIAPPLDPRNHFAPGTPYAFGYYTERRVRSLVSLGLRLSTNVEFFLSTSVYRRQIRNTESAGDQALDAVFDAATVAGVGNDNPWTSYAEVAARFDTRTIRTRPWPGLLFEGYAGGGHDLAGQAVAFLRAGGRAQAYIPIYRKTNLLSPRLVIDAVQPIGDTVLPFTELARQPDFRGFDTRRDLVSMVGSLDYTWLLLPALGVRVFFDAATVAPGLNHVTLDPFKYMRYAGGLGLDIYTSNSTLASVGISGSSDGVRLVATIGVPSGYGDRQHRD